VIAFGRRLPPVPSDGMMVHPRAGSGRDRVVDCPTCQQLGPCQLPLDPDPLLPLDPDPLVILDPDPLLPLDPDPWLILDPDPRHRVSRHQRPA
jgi:hypothetical protein